MTTDPADRPNFVDRFFIALMKPENLGRILRWAWFISLLMLAMGYIIIFTKIKQFLPI